MFPKKKHRGRDAKHDDCQYHHHDGCDCLLSPAEQVKSRGRQNNIDAEKYCTSNGACEIRGCEGRHHKLLEGRLGLSTGIIYAIEASHKSASVWPSLGPGDLFLPGSLPLSSRFVCLLSIGGKYCGGFSNFNFANPVTPGFTINVSYTSARHKADSGDSDGHEKQSDNQSLRKFKSIW